MPDGIPAGNLDGDSRAIFKTIPWKNPRKAFPGWNLRENSRGIRKRIPDRIKEFWRNF